MASAIQPPPITIEQYLEFKSPEGYYDELIRGRIIVSPEPKLLHNEIAEILCRLLRTAVGDPFMVGQRVNFKFASAFSMPSPDIFVLKKEDWIASREADEYPDGSKALLFVEVVSPGNRLSKLQTKAELYQEHGVDAWIVHPQKREVTVFRKGELATFRKGLIALPSSLPEASIDIADIFAIRR